MPSSPEPRISPAKAVLWGHLYVTIPQISILAAGFLFGYQLRGVLDDGLFYFFASVLPAGLWWSFAAPHWWAWVRRDGVDPERTRVLARKACLGSRRLFSRQESDVSGRLVFRLWVPAILCACLGMFIAVYLRPVTILAYVKWQARTSTGMWVVPVPLPEVPIERTGGRQFSYFGYEFEVPWSELERERLSESSVTLYFSNRAVVVFFDPRQHEGYLDIVRKHYAELVVDFDDLLDAEVTRSSYALFSRMLHAKPDDLSLFSSRQRMVTDSVLLLEKDIFFGHIRGALHSFETEWLRGFQEGDPAEDSLIVIDAYDARDLTYALWVGGPEYGARPTQADVNRILFSLRPVSGGP